MTSQRKKRAIALVQFYEKDQQSSYLHCKLGMINNNKALVYLQGLSSVQGKRKYDADITHLALAYARHKNGAVGAHPLTFYCSSMMLIIVS